MSHDGFINPLGVWPSGSFPGEVIVNLPDSKSGSVAGSGAIVSERIHSETHTCLQFPASIANDFLTTPRARREDSEGHLTGDL